MRRSCARPACTDLAVATLAYDYDARTVWMRPLAAERSPLGHDMCDRHANGLLVPRGWTFDDRRSAEGDPEAMAS